MSPNPKKKTVSGFSRREVLRYTGLLSLAASVTAGISACGGPASTSSVSGNAGSEALSAIIGYGNNQSWDPTQSASAFSMAAFQHIYEGLVDTDPVTREPYAALATELPDTKTASWEFKLREGATWHDGKPVTADDVVFTFERILNPESEVLVHQYFSAWLKNVEKVDETTVKLNLLAPVTYGLQRLTIAKILPKHILAANGTATTADWDKLKSGKPEFSIGSGPYKHTVHAEKSNDSFEAFDKYTGPRKPNFKSMNWFSITDASARVAKISGSNAGAQISDNIPSTNAESLRSSGLTVDQAAGMNNLTLAFNPNAEFFSDSRVRQALRYAINVETINEKTLKGTAAPAQSLLNKDNPSFIPAKTIYDYNIEKAKSLLKEAGVPEGFKVTLRSVNVSWLVDVLPSIVEAWKAVGLDVSTQPQDTAALFSELAKGTDFQVFAAASNPNQFGNDPDLITRSFYSPAGVYLAPTKFAETAEFKATFQKVEDAVQEADPEKQKTLVAEYLNEIAEQAVVYPVFFVDLITAYDGKKLSNVQGLGYPGLNLLQSTPA
ncbi:ABC transporter substrate-binding protein [Arthrobacter psychrolactophilus]|uniref:ABC transporter substrate-binding protein n=1 Tax=Arthrobacter psychrolactophilus TaxID=92442 RepID=A0A2V5IYE0_9MICC|nr:ABC transporter substrate-binding protein [Arthrobacter psychrolactophilus]PYI39413.1 ABC transporter substrate-binding protein [Arthrobacter psychrolactophilus]